MKHSMKTREGLGKPKNHDFSFNNFMHPEKSPGGVVNTFHLDSATISKVAECQYQLAYDSWNTKDSQGKRIPAKRQQIGYRPQGR